MVEKTRSLITCCILTWLLVFTGYAKACSSGWSSYGGNCYKLFTSTKEWAVAYRDCQRYGANLVSIESSGEQTFLENLIGGTTAWASGSDANHEGAWAWYSGFSSWSYTKWNRGEPNNSGGEHCLHILTNRNGWNDLPCNRALAYVCEVHTGQSTCDSNWHTRNNKCYRMFGKTNWISALRTCQSNGANLVSVDDSGEQSYLEGLIGGNTVWTSGIDSTKENYWFFASGTRSWSYTKWNRGEPNNSGGEGCIHILTNRNGWNDLKCSNTNVYTMCEKPAPVVHGGWSSWGSWGGCTRSCASGTKSRSRSCNNPSPQNGGNNCAGSSSSSTSCNTHNCPVHGNWGGWGSWGSCSKTCASGTKTRSRSCNNPAPRYNGNNCAGSSSSSTSCNTHNCPIHGNWGGWGSWGSCSKTCASGTKSRSRSCNNPAPLYNGNNCAGSSSSSTSCNTHNCPIHGNWGGWGSWGSCSKTCASGTKTRSRSCNNPAPRYNGNNCAGSSSSSTSCNTHHCPIHGGWTNWAAWGTCTVTCGGGTQNRGRTCTNPRPQYNGNGCSGSTSSTQSCNTHHCPIDGGWASWSAWGSCTESCGGGIQTKSRTCSNPTPQYNGAYCPDYSSNTQTCNTHHCPIHGAWAAWGSWGSCTVTCGGGSQSRSRTCTNPRPQYQGNNCPSSSTSTQSCNTQPCPIDGAWASWGSYGTCSVTCGGGTQSRTRTCSNPTPQHGGAACAGPNSSSQDCNTQVCIIDGAWGAWAAWGSCTKTCAGGKRSRSRVCNDPAPANGGLPCPGGSGQFDDCNTQACPTVPAGTYQQLCPTGWFTCQSGGITCIDDSFRCDCSADCDDGSDEDATYASCTNAEECQEDAAGTPKMSSLLVIAAVMLVWSIVNIV